ncbi:hypothetical protein EHZ19_26920 [Paraburkholderia bannensis]|nr:hypothetical protein [Paraburkholderia bannensis]RQM44738.1 hypothetical protein EHZ19_26920 [Paraburkholderia bannensis]
MAKKTEFSLTGHIPPNAKSVTIAFSSTNASAKALLHRFSGDASPAVLHGPKGNIDVSVGDGRTLTLETLDDADWEIGVAGYSF